MLLQTAQFLLQSPASNGTVPMDTFITRIANVMVNNNQVPGQRSAVLSATAVSIATRVVMNSMVGIGDAVTYGPNDEFAIPATIQPALPDGTMQTRSTHWNFNPYWWGEDAQ